MSCLGSIYHLLGELEAMSTSNSWAPYLEGRGRYLKCGFPLHLSLSFSLSFFQCCKRRSCCQRYLCFKSHKAGKMRFSWTSLKPKTAFFPAFTQRWWKESLPVPNAMHRLALTLWIKKVKRFKEKERKRQRPFSLLQPGFAVKSSKEQNPHREASLVRSWRISENAWNGRGGLVEGANDLLPYTWILTRVVHRAAGGHATLLPTVFSINIPKLLL